jgi:hypothetical protein
MLTFAPDLDQTQPGVLAEVTNMAPSPRGYAACPSAVSSGMSAMAAACVGAFQTVRLDGTTRFFAGTPTKMYEQVGTTWTDVSRATAYNASADSPWRFCQFGDSTIAANSGDILQRATTGSFADISGAPHAALVDAAEGFVMVANTSTATDEWYCSAFRDETNWTTSVATQCAKGRLVDAPGPIIGLRALGSNFVAYKARSMFLGIYGGGAAVWDWQRIPVSVGALSNESIVSVGNGHYFVGADDVWYFDGSRPMSIGGPVRQWFYGRMNNTYAYKTKALHDRKNGLIYWFYATADSTLDSALIYSYRYDRFGHMSLPIECCVETMTGGYTIDGMDALSATIDGLPDIPFDSPYWSASSAKLGIFDTSHVFKTLSGSAATSGITTGVYGDDAAFQNVSRVTPRMAQMPASATLTHQYADNLGDAWATASSSALNYGKFDCLWSSRWHRFSLQFVGPCEITNYKIFATPDGLQ